VNVYTKVGTRSRSGSSSFAESGVFTGCAARAQRVASKRRVRAPARDGGGV